MVAVKAEGKTDFARQVLVKNPHANAKAVNTAWNDAGNAGGISTTLVQKIRAELGLTGNIRPGVKASGTNGSAKPAKPKGRRPGRPKGTTSARSNGSHATSSVSPRVGSSSRAHILEELEGDVDRLLFKVMGVGGLSEVEDALRKARRLLVLGHRS